LAMFISAAPAAITGTVIPNSISPVLNPGEAQMFSFDYCASIESGGTGKADILLLTDTTPSMGGYISVIKTAFGEIQSKIATDLPNLDVRYGVADYKDYRDAGYYASYGVATRQPFTSDTSAVQTAIDDLYGTGGYDDPEEQLKAFVSLAKYWMNPSGDIGLNGRPDAQKILIWAGDAEGHFAGEVTPDGPEDFYPSLAEALDALNSQGILAFGLNLKSAQEGIDAYGGGANQATYLTDGTGGDLVNDLVLTSAGLRDAVANAVMQSVEVLTNITLAVEAEGVLIDQMAQTSIGSWTPGDGEACDTFTFEITGFDDPGTVDFDMVLLGNGAELDRVNVHLTTVPEPTTILLLGFGGLGLYRKRRI